MFGFAPPQLSKEEIEQLEAEASSTVQRFLTTAVLLYICAHSSLTPPSPADVIYLGLRKKLGLTDSITSAAPFLVDVVSSVL
ncbi:hypothetical protein F5X99DRAFT_405494 [Biscogniauxia marginata]|nr:hypothetical protein F5X99DRAFT_405494 [Biscogniauxia marginata]